MPAVILAAKAALAVMLLVAGGAKLADLTGFAAAVRLFTPRRLAGAASAPTALRMAAAGLALAELALGGASLAAPEAGGLNLAVLALACGFVVVAAAGYVFHRGRSCRCFGALSRRRFDRAGIGRAAAVAVVAAVATTSVPAADIQLGPAAHGLLAGAACLLAGVAFTAARALAVSRDALPGVL
jgi:hypothetical protein